MSRRLRRLGRGCLGLLIGLLAVVLLIHALIVLLEALLLGILILASGLVILPGHWRVWRRSFSRWTADLAAQAAAFVSALASGVGKEEVRSRNNAEVD